MLLQRPIRYPTNQVLSTCSLPSKITRTAVVRNVVGVYPDEDFCEDFACTWDSVSQAII